MFCHDPPGDAVPKLDDGELRMLSNDLQRCGLHHCGSRLRQHLFCSAEAFGALRLQAVLLMSGLCLRPSSPRDLTTACYLLGIVDGGPGSAWRAVHSALADAVLTAKVVMAMNAILQEAPPSECTALPPLPCRLQRVSEAAETKTDIHSRKRRLPMTFSAE
eukprot:s4468_g4.t1